MFKDLIICHPKEFVGYQPNWVEETIVEEVSRFIEDYEFLWNFIEAGDGGPDYFIAHYNSENYNFRNSIVH